MSPVEKQRLAGSVLLLLIISGMAVFLMLNAGDPSPALDEQQSSDPAQNVFNSSIEAIIKLDTVPTEHEVVVATDQAKASPTETVIKTTSPPPVEAAQKIIADAKIEHIITAENNSPAVDNNKQETWILQLASFSVQDNAKKLQQQVIKLGYQAFILAVNTESTTIYRLQIGPSGNKQSLEKIAEIMKTKFQLKAQLIRNK